MMAFDADASRTSDSFIAPTPEWMMRIFTLLVASASASVSASTSAEPCTSALMMIGSSFMPPSAICCCSDSSVRRPPLPPSAFSLACSWRNVAICRALVAIVDDLEHIARLRQRRRGRALRPAWTAPPTSPGWPRSSKSARTLPSTGPAMKSVALVQRAVLHEDGRDRAAPVVQLRLEHRALRAALRIRLQLADVARRAESSRAAGRGSSSAAPTLRR